MFRKPGPLNHLESVNGPKDGWEIENWQGGNAKFRVWRPGSYDIKTSDGRTCSFTVDAVPHPLVLSGPWQVCFAPVYDDPKSVVFDKLVPWNTHPDDDIRHFSGTATYKTSFDMTDSQAKLPLRLRLGEVRDIAAVRLNGKSLGVVWTAPWRVDLTNMIRKGTNSLAIDVTNTWVNRLIGDAGLPPEKRRAKTNVRLQAGKRHSGKFPVWKGFVSEDPLEPSGLLGPVYIEYPVCKEVHPIK